MVSSRIFLLAMFMSASEALLTLGNPRTAHPSLDQFSQVPLKEIFQIRLDIAGGGGGGGGDDLGQQRLCLQGPTFQLCDSGDSDSDNLLLPLPGTNGPRPHLSTGANSIEIVKEAFVVDLEGMKTVPFEKGSWEMVWQKGSRAGNLVCGFHLPEPVSRNQAHLPAGCVYVTFPVWTRSSLAEDQAYKNEVETQQRDYLNQRDQALQEIREGSGNLLQKALLYREAAVALENAASLDYRNVGLIPNKEDTVELSDPLVLTKHGTVWTKEGGFNLGGRHELLGRATVSLVSEDA